jgi:hypothetical protein
MDKSFTHTIQSLQNMYHVLETYNDYYDGSKDESIKLMTKFIKDIENVISKTENSYTKLITSPNTQKKKSRKFDEDLIQMQDVINRFFPMMIYYSINTQTQTQTQTQTDMPPNATTVE